MTGKDGAGGSGASESDHMRGVTGIVLAGGRSSRFGSDKLRATLDGRPILELAIEAVGAVASSVVVVAAPGADLELPASLADRVSVIHDPEPFGGPLVGLAAALATVRTPRALVVGGDMPRLVPAVLRRLVAALPDGGPERPDEPRAVTLEVPDRVQPLPMALVAGPALDAARRLLAGDRRSLRELLVELGAVPVPAAAWLELDPGAATIVDIDRPADLDA